MSLKRTLTTRLPLAAGFAAGSSLLLSLAGVFDCSSYPTFKDVPTDCSAESTYEFYSRSKDPRAGMDRDAGPSRDLTLDDPSKWFGSADYTLDGGGSFNDPYLASMPSTPLSGVFDGGLCATHASAMIFKASHNNDWGGLYGNWSFAQAAHNDASDWNGEKDYWEGIAFWARAPGATSKAFTIAIDDQNTAVETTDDAGVTVIPANCRYYPSDNSSSGGVVAPDPNAPSQLSGSGTTRATNPDECGNSYSKAVLVTNDWRFYPIPFSEFKQDLKPNRVPNSSLDTPYNAKLKTRMITSALRGISFRMTKEAEMELWVAGLAFYHKRQ